MVRRTVSSYIRLVRNYSTTICLSAFFLVPCFGGVGHEGGEKRLRGGNSPYDRGKEGRQTIARCFFFFFLVWSCLHGLFCHIPSMKVEEISIPGKIHERGRIPYLRWCEKRKEFKSFGPLSDEFALCLCNLFIWMLKLVFGTLFRFSGCRSKHFV